MRPRTVLFAPSRPMTYRARIWAGWPAASVPRRVTPSGASSTASAAKPHRTSTSGSSPTRASCRSPSSAGWLNIEDSGQPDAARTGAAEAQQSRAGAVAPLVDLGRLADGPQLPPDAARLEDSSDLVVEMTGPRPRVRVGPPLDHDHSVAELAQQDGQGAAHGAVADDGDVGVAVGVDG